MKLDILAFGAHPDDIELSCSGTILKAIHQGKKAGVVDLSKGELGTRGTAETRAIEAANASAILGLSARENLEIEDGFMEYNKINLAKIISVIRKYQPEIVLCNSISDRHPDHGNASKLVSEACFYAGLLKYQNRFIDIEIPWRPKAVYHYIQDRFMHPNFLVDISVVMDKKIESIKAYSSQFYFEKSDEPQTPISSKQFFDTITERASTLGRIINCEYAEGFVTERYPGINCIFDLK
ncbi:MAG: bacillithiol biosynthesis deacetylase BshB1 [Bacteroidota bacterium]|jgi:bacillithiol biosynthesis deacetylase BshB1